MYPPFDFLGRLFSQINCWTRYVIFYFLFTNFSFTAGEKMYVYFCFFSQVPNLHSSLVNQQHYYLQYVFGILHIESPSASSLHLMSQSFYHKDRPLLPTMILTGSPLLRFEPPLSLHDIGKQEPTLINLYFLEIPHHLMILLLILLFC